jgi:hypothetical protein
MFINDTTFAHLDGKLFRYHYNETTPRPYNFRGMQGWFTVPRGWNVRYNANQQAEASPNQDFSAPLYQCEMNDDGFLVFQDLSLSRGQSRSIWPNNIKPPGTW